MAVDAGDPEPADAAAPLPACPSSVESPSPPVASSEPVAVEAADVKLRDAVVLRLLVADGSLSPRARAARASRALEAALAEPNPARVRAETGAERAILLVGDRPILELTRKDAEAAKQDSLELLVASTETRVRDALASERQRSAIARTVFNVSLVVFLAVLVLYTLRLLGSLSRRIRTLVEEKPERVPAIRLRSIEVVGPHVLRSTLLVGLGVTRVLLQLGLIYAWLLFSSSLFDATRGFAGHLGSLGVAPLSSFMTRLAQMVPVLLLLTLAAVLLVVLWRFVTLFFRGVQTGETDLSWLRAEQARPVSLILRTALVIAGLVFLGPAITGDSDGALPRIGLLLLAVVGLAAAPWLANVIVGLATVHQGRLRVGDRVEIGSYRGTVQAIDLSQIRLLCGQGQEQVRFSHLALLGTPVRCFLAEAHGSRRLRIEAEGSGEELLSCLRRLCDEKGWLATVRLLRLQGKTCTVSLRFTEAEEPAEEQVLLGVSCALHSEGLALVLAEWGDDP